MIVSGESALIFTGQGSQFVGMGQDLYDAFPVAREVYELADRMLDRDLSGLCFRGPLPELTLTDNVQPAIVTFDLAILAVLHEAERLNEARFTAGHSLGEYAALAYAGVLAPPDAIRLARKRGELMQAAAELQGGGMVAVLGLADEAIDAICGETGTFVANRNCPGQIVISGSDINLDKASELARIRGASKIVRLQVSGAFHSPLMTSASRGLSETLDHFPVCDASIPVVANTTATPVTTPSAIKTELVNQLSNTVEWQKSVEYMVAAGIKQFIEIGPARTLAGLIRRIDRNIPTFNICDAGTLRSFLNEEII